MTPDNRFISALQLYVEVMIMVDQWQNKMAKIWVVEIDLFHAWVTAKKFDQPGRRALIVLIGPLPIYGDSLSIFAKGPYVDFKA
jgi:hypothetical protein